MPGTVQLTRGKDRSAAVTALTRATGGRVGLGGVLADLNRVAERSSAPGTAAAWAFRWDRADSRSRRWWPQGITTSADASPDETYAGRSLVITSSYAKHIDGVAQGARISVVDVTDPDRLRYRNVLLVRAVLDDDGAVDLRPVHAHAGGIVWRGRHLHVAATAKGVCTFDLDDIVPMGAGAGQPGMGRQPDGSLRAHGYRYVLPLHHSYDATADETTPLRYSFISLVHRSSGAAAGDEMLAGEYGRGDMTTRLVRFPIDPDGLPLLDTEGSVTPQFHTVGGTHRMQGAVEVDGRLYVTTSAGPLRRGSVWTGSTLLARHRRVLPVGPEDIAYWPSTDRLWTVTEYPDARLVLAIDRSRFDH